ncbi:hypothetical protein [Sphingomonas aerophila]|uniref:Uncharacterized protein n=1 Tax=Sphingomonas aerophila TaxID=1344948 RepID=A0A7W9ESJ4_9SPHN|nr:hypothetical protein [Sphingomonas aerophila]MBB5713195.1 hypothetical protein [Sphingomonas aerophila]
MDEDVAEQAEQRSEIHFLAALVDELMRTMLDAGTLTRAQLNDIERVAAEKAGQTPRAW